MPPDIATSPPHAQDQLPGSPEAPARVQTPAQALWRMREYMRPYYFYMFLMVTALAGGALALLLLNLRSDWVKPYLAGAPPWFARLTTSGAAVPYGVAIAVGALAEALLGHRHDRFEGRAGEGLPGGDGALVAPLA